MHVSMSSISMFKILQEMCSTLVDFAFPKLLGKKSNFQENDLVHIRLSFSSRDHQSPRTNTTLGFCVNRKISCNRNHTFRGGWRKRKPGFHSAAVLRVCDMQLFRFRYRRYTGW